uniref:Protein kinase domain-containing protein n=1 Tax=Plectus sambesii TaxID=2011161 RepID=A0A914W9M9_9BILA
MARRVNDSDIYRPLTDGVLPYKWMPPETFERILPDGSRRVGDFLKKSDVWSFGALLIEVVTMGKDPEVVTQSSKCHPTIMKDSPYRVLQSVTSRRNELDKHLRNKLLPVIQDCWRWEEATRPTFQELTNRLVALLQ